MDQLRTEYTNVLARAFDLAPVRNTLCSTSQSVSLVSIAQLLTLHQHIEPFEGASDFEIGKELSM